MIFASASKVHIYVLWVFSISVKIDSCESANMRFQQGEGPSRYLLRIRDSDIFADLRLQLYALLSTARPPQNVSDVRRVR